MNSSVGLLLNSAIAFVVACASVLVVAEIARFAAGYFASERASRIAAFGIALGYVLGHFSGASAATLEELPALGALAGLIGAWAWLLRRGERQLIDVDA